MVEVMAAVIGAAIGVVSTGISGFVRKDSEASMAVVRLTSAVEHIASEVSMLRAEIREDSKELYPRLSKIEQRLSALEAKL